MVFWLLFSNESFQNILILSAIVAPFASADIRLVVNRFNQDITVNYVLVFCLFSWPYMVKWYDSGIIMACIVLSLEAVKSVNSESIDIFGPKNQEEKPKEMTRTKVSAKGWRHVTSSAWRHVTSSAWLRFFNSFPVSKGWVWSSGWT